MNTKQDIASTSIWDMPVPTGYVRDSQGKLIHQSQVSEADTMRSGLVEDLVSRAKGLSENVNGFHESAFQEMAAFASISAERFGAKIGETASYSMTSIDGRFRVTCDVDQGVAINESIAAAKVLLDECLADWSAGGKPQMVALLANTFKPTRSGKISITRVFDLLRNRNLPEFKGEEKFQRLCGALEAAIQTTGKRRYIRFYSRRTPADKWEMVAFGN